MDSSGREVGGCILDGVAISVYADAVQVEAAVLFIFSFRV